MRRTIHQSYALLLIISVALLLSSFSLAPPTKKASEAPPQVQKKLQVEKRRQRLKMRLAKADNTIKKTRLQKRLRRLEERETNVKPTSILGVLGLIAGILSVVVLIVALGVSAAAALSGGGTGLLLGTILFWGGIGLAAIGLGLSILHLVLRQRDYDRYNKPGFAIAGLILNGLLLGFLLLAALGGSIQIAAAY